jgi:hypothetical protein
MKSSFFWDIMPCSPLKVTRHFPLKHRFTFNGLHDVISKMIELFSLPVVILLLFNKIRCRMPEVSFVLSGRGI